MQTNGSLLNLMLPLLLIACIILTLYALVLFIRSITKKSPELRAKAGKIAILPVLYIIGMSIYFVHLTDHDRQMIRQLPGTYVFHVGDSLQFSATLKPGRLFTFQMGADTMSGHWQLIPYSESIRFFDASGKEFTHSTLATDSGRLCLPFNFNGKQIRLYKQ
jgi:hypothetical protein